MAKRRSLCHLMKILIIGIKRPSNSRKTLKVDFSCRARQRSRWDNGRYLVFPLIFLRRVVLPLPSQQEQSCSSDGTEYWPKHAPNSEAHHRREDQYCANGIKWMISESSF